MFCARKRIAHFVFLSVLAALMAWTSKTQAGSVAGWGRGTEGQLGHGLKELSRDPKTGAVLNQRSSIPLSPNQPVLVDLPESVGIARDDASYFATLGIEKDDIKQVCAGREHSLLLTTSGRVYAWGNSTKKAGKGRLGDSSTPADRQYPSLIPPESFENRKIVQVAAGDFHSLAVDETGQVWGWGDNSFGQLGRQGLPTDSPQRIWEVSPVKTPEMQKQSALQPIKICIRNIKTKKVVELKVPPAVLKRALTPDFVPVQRPFIAAGEKHSLIIGESNGFTSQWCLYAMGDNSSGQTTSSSGEPTAVVLDGTTIAPTWVVAGPQTSLAFEDQNVSGEWTLNTGFRALGWGDNSHNLFGEAKRLLRPAPIPPPAALFAGKKRIPIEDIHISYKHALIRIKRQPQHQTAAEQVILIGQKGIEAAKSPNISSLIADSDDSSSLYKQSVSATTANGEFSAVAISRVAVIQCNYRAGKFLINDAERQKFGAAVIVPGSKVSGNGIHPRTVISKVEYEQSTSPLILPRAISFTVSVPPIVEQLGSILEVRPSPSEGHSLIAQGVDEVHDIHAVIVNGTIQSNSSVMRVSPTALEHYAFAVDQAQPAAPGGGTGTTDSVSLNTYSNQLSGNRSKVSPICPGMKVYGPGIAPNTVVKQVIPNDGLVIMSAAATESFRPAGSTSPYVDYTSAIRRQRSNRSSRFWNFTLWHLSGIPSSARQAANGLAAPVFGFDPGLNAVDSMAGTSESGFLFVPPTTVVLRDVQCDLNSPFNLKASPVDSTATLENGMQIASLPHPVALIDDRSASPSGTNEAIDENDAFSLEKLTSFDIGTRPTPVDGIPVGTRINPRIRLVDFTPSATDGSLSLKISHRITGNYPAPGYQNKGVLIAFRHNPTLVGDTVAGAGIPQGSVVRQGKYIDDTGRAQGDRTLTSQFWDDSDFVKTITSGENTVLHSVTKFTPPSSVVPSPARDSSNVIVTRAPPSSIIGWGDNSSGQLGDGGAASTSVSSTSPVLVNSGTALSGFDTCSLVSGRSFIFAVSPSTSNNSYRGRWDIIDDKLFRNEQSNPTDANLALRLFARVDFSRQPNPFVTSSGMLNLSAELKGRYNFESLFRFDRTANAYVHDVNQPFQYPALPSPQGNNSPADFEPVVWSWFQLKNNKTTPIDPRRDNLNNQRGTQINSTVISGSTTKVDLVNYTLPYFNGLNRSSNLITLLQNYIDTERDRPLERQWSSTAYQTNRDGGATLPGEAEITSSSRLTWRGSSADMDISGKYFAVALIRDASGNSIRVQSETVEVIIPPTPPEVPDLVAQDGETKKIVVETSASSTTGPTQLKTPVKTSYQWFSRPVDSAPDDFKPVRNGITSELPITFVPGLAAYFKCRIVDSANVWESTPAMVWSVPSPKVFTLTRRGSADASPGRTVGFSTSLTHALPFAIRLRRSESNPFQSSPWRQSRTTSIPLESVRSDSPEDESAGVYFRRGYVLETVVPIPKRTPTVEDAEYSVSESRSLIRQILVKKSVSPSNAATYSVSYVKAGPGTLASGQQEVLEEPPAEEDLLLTYRNPKNPSEVLSLPLEVGSTISDLTASDLRSAKLQWKVSFPPDLAADFEESIKSKSPIPGGYSEPDYQNFFTNVWSFDSSNGGDPLSLLRNMVPTGFPSNRDILRSEVEFFADVPAPYTEDYQPFFGDFVADARFINPKRLSSVAVITSDPIHLSATGDVTPKIDSTAEQTPLEGRSLTLRCTNSASKGAKFQWYRQTLTEGVKSPIPGQTSPRLTFTSLKQSDSSIYYVGILNPGDATPSYSEGFDLRVVPVSSFFGTYSSLLAYQEPNQKTEDAPTATLGRVTLSVLPSGAFSGRSEYRGYTDSLSGTVSREGASSLNVTNRKANRRYVVDISMDSRRDTVDPDLASQAGSFSLSLTREDALSGKPILSQFVLPGESVALAVSGNKSTPRWKLNGIEINPNGYHSLLFKRGILSFAGGGRRLLINSMTKETSGVYQSFTSDGKIVASPPVNVLITTPSVKVVVSEMNDTGMTQGYNAAFTASKVPSVTSRNYGAVKETPTICTAALEGGAESIGKISNNVDGYMSLTVAKEAGSVAFAGKMASGESFSGSAIVNDITEDVPVVPIYSEFRSMSSTTMNWLAGSLNLPSQNGPRSLPMVSPQLQTFVPSSRKPLSGLTLVGALLQLSARISEVTLLPYLPPSSSSQSAFLATPGAENLDMYLWGLARNSSVPDSPTYLPAMATPSGITIDPPNPNRIILKVDRATGVVSGSGINPTSTRRDTYSLLKFEGVTSTVDGNSAPKSFSVGFFKFGPFSSPIFGRWEVTPSN